MVYITKISRQYDKPLSLCSKVQHNIRDCDCSRGKIRDRDSGVSLRRERDQK